MNRTLFIALLVCSLFSWAAPLGVYQHGTVVRMRMGECTLLHRGFVSAFGGPQVQVLETCPEYTLVADKVVFVIVGRNSNQLVPLAESIDFRFHKNELAVRVDDARRESKFVIKEMILRSNWDLLQKHLEEQINDYERQATDSTMMLKSR